MTLLRPGRTDEGEPASVARLRRWIRRRRVAARGAVPLESIYVVGLTLLVTGAIVGPRLGPTFWPDRPVSTPEALTPTVLLALVGCALLVALRRLGPLVVNRADLTWLYPAPVSRRTLLRPALHRAVTGAALLGAGAAAVAVGRLATRPVAGERLVGAVLLGAGLGALVALAAVAGQHDPRRGRLLDLVGTLTLLLSGGTLLARPVLPDWRPAVAVDPLLWAAAGAAVSTAALLTAIAVRRLDALPARRLTEVADAASGWLDAVYAVDPSYLAERRHRRFWRGRALRSHPVRRWGGLPVPVVQDLLVLRRRKGRLGWLVGAALVPAMLTGAPGWLLATVVGLGAMSTAGTTMDAVRRDVGQPALVRLLGLTGRQVVAGRLVVPAILAGAWTGLALTALQVRAGLPAGPWWALGLAVGPVAAVAAVHRARAGRVDLGMPLVDTPMGSFAPGPIIWLLTGPDLLVPLSLPLLTLLLGGPGGEPPGPVRVLAQAVLGVLGVAGYLLWLTDRRRSTL